VDAVVAELDAEERAGVGRERRDGRGPAAGGARLGDALLDQPVRPELRQQVGDRRAREAGVRGQLAAGQRALTTQRVEDGEAVRVLPRLRRTRSLSRMSTPEDLTPRPEHRFTFGLWTVGNPGRDPFGEPTRAPVDPADSVRRLAELGAWGVSLHDNDVVPWGSSAAEHDRLVARFKAALEETGMGVGMATTNLFTTPPSRTAPSPSNDRAIRRAAIGKAMRSIDLGAELARRDYVFWGGREGTRRGPAKDPRDASDATARRSTSSASYVVEQGYDLRFAIEPKPNEPRGTTSCRRSATPCTSSPPSSGPSMCGVNPEVAHETMAGLSFLTGSARPCGPGKLFTSTSTRSGSAATTRTSASARRTSRRRSCSCGCSSARATTGPRHFDAHAYRNEDADGVWDFARGCMRTYLALAEKARRFDALPRRRRRSPPPARPSSPSGRRAGSARPTR
jgi:xylose isomerase